MCVHPAVVVGGQIVRRVAVLGRPCHPMTALLRSSTMHAQPFAAEGSSGWPFWAGAAVVLALGLIALIGLLVRGRNRSRLAPPPCRAVRGVIRFLRARPRSGGKRPAAGATPSWCRYRMRWPWRLPWRPWS